MVLFDVSVTQTGIAGVVVAALTVATSYLTSRAANKAAVRTTQISSRTQIEEGAFDRAKDYYTDVITRQAAQIDELEHDLATEKRERSRETGELRAKVMVLEHELAGAQREISRLSAN